MTKTVMVVDDEDDIRNLIKAVLENGGYNVITATNGDDCLEKLKITKPDLILLDIMMPGLPVMMVIKKIKDTKVVYLSVLPKSVAEKNELLNSECVVDYIQKPFDTNKLLKRVREIIG